MSIGVKTSNGLFEVHFFFFLFDDVFFTHTYIPVHCTCLLYCTMTNSLTKPNSLIQRNYMCTNKPFEDHIFIQLSWVDTYFLELPATTLEQAN